MDRVEEYKELIVTILQEKVEKIPKNMPNIWHQLVIDEARKQFILLAMGWHKNEYIHDWIFHIELKNEQIWVHEDLSDPGIKLALLEKDVPESDIVLAYLPIYEEKSTDDMGMALAV